MKLPPLYTLDYWKREIKYNKSIKNSLSYQYRKLGRAVQGLGRVIFFSLKLNKYISISKPNQKDI